MKTYPTFKVNITKQIEFSDPITLDDINQTVEEYIHKDKNNIVILYDADGSGVNRYFFTNRSTDEKGAMMMAWMEDENSFYGCKEVSTRVLMDKNNLDTQTEYLSLRSFGMNVNHNYCNMDKIIESIINDDENDTDNNYKNQLYVLYNLDTGFKSYASIASVKAGVAQSGALHCQDGYNSKTSILLNAQPATTDYEQNLNEPPPILHYYEPGSPDWPPPSQLSPIYDPNSQDGSPPSQLSPIYNPNSQDGSPPSQLSPILRVIDTPDGSPLSSMDIQTGGGGNEVAIFAAMLGKWLILHPLAKIILYKRYNVRETTWCSFPVLRLAQELLGECCGRSVQVAIGEANDILELADIESRGEIEPTYPQVTGGRRKTRRNKIKGGRKSRKMNKKQNTHRRSKKSKSAV
jgi:hypothetical protein